MEQITLGDIAAWAGFAVMLGGSVAAIIKGVKKVVEKLLEPIQKRLDAVDLENCKNYLVTFLAGVERGQEHDEIELERFHEQLGHYQQIGGNSYIKSKVEKLQKEGKL